MHQPGRLLFQLLTFVGGIKQQILGRNRFVPGVDETLDNAARVQSDAKLAVSIMNFKLRSPRVVASLVELPEWEFRFKVLSPVALTSLGRQLRFTPAPRRSD